MKRKIAAFITLALLLNLFALSGCGKSAQEDSRVTRGEWITMLAQAFGMDSPVGTDPHYADVSPDSPLFAYVQSAFEWDVLSIYADEQLKPDKGVTRLEVASTAAIAAGCEVTEEQRDSKGRFDPDGSVAWAVQYGILEDNARLSAGMTREECEAAVAAARSAYLNQPVTEKVIVQRSEDLVDLTQLDVEKLDVEELTEDEERITIPAEYSVGVTGTTALINTDTGVVEVSEGDIFVTAPTAEAPAGTAYKVTAVQEIGERIVLATQTPTLYDLYEELDVSATATADPDDVIWLVGTGSTSGVQGMVAQQGDSFHISVLSCGTDTAGVTPLDKKSYQYGGFSKPFEFGKGSFKSNWTNRSSSDIGSGAGAQALANSRYVYDGHPSVDDFNGLTESWSKDLELDNTVTGGYKITGNISINALTVTTSIEYKKIWDIPYGVKNASVQVNSDISATLKLEGTLSETLHIATVPIPIAATGLSVDVDLYLYATANGSLVVTAGLGSKAKIEYNDGKLKHSASSEATADVNANIKVDFGAQLAATLEALGIVKIVDVRADVGGTLTVKAGISGACKVSEEDGVSKLTYQESMSFYSDLCVPLVTLSAGGSDTLVGKMGLQGKWKILTSEKGAKHYEIANYEWVFWEQTVLNEADGNVIEGEAYTAGEESGIGASQEDRLDFQCYILTLQDDAVRVELDLDEGEAVPDVIWTSDDSAVAIVDSTGLVTPVGAGYTIITATLRANPSVYVKCAVYVEKPEEHDWVFLPSDLSAIIV